MMKGAGNREPPEECSRTGKTRSMKDVEKRRKHPSCGLITRRSRVQIPPLQPEKAPIWGPYVAGASAPTMMPMTSRHLWVES